MTSEDKPRQVKQKLTGKKKQNFTIKHDYNVSGSIAATASTQDSSLALSESNTSFEGWMTT